MGAKLYIHKSSSFISIVGILISQLEYEGVYNESRLLFKCLAVYPYLYKHESTHYISCLIYTSYLLFDFHLKEEMGFIVTKEKGLIKQRGWGVISAPRK